MIFVDRKPRYPGRYTMTAEDGSTSRVVLERADEPDAVGTLLNAETFNGIFEEVDRKFATVDEKLDTVDNRLATADQKFAAADQKFATVDEAVAGRLPMTESNEHPGCFYRMVGGEEEWLNPPMVDEMHYRTIERHKGLPVYVMSRSTTQAANAAALLGVGAKKNKIISAFAVVRYVGEAEKSNGTRVQFASTETLGDLAIRAEEDEDVNYAVLTPFVYERNVVVTVKYVKE